MPQRSQSLGLEEIKERFVSIKGKTKTRKEGKKNGKTSGQGERKLQELKVKKWEEPI